MANINSTWPLSCNADITPNRISTTPIILPCSLQPLLLTFASAVANNAADNTANNQALLSPASDAHLPRWMMLPPMPVGVLVVIISCQEQPPCWEGAAAPNPTIHTCPHPTCCPFASVVLSIWVFVGQDRGSCPKNAIFQMVTKPFLSVLIYSTRCEYDILKVLLKKNDQNPPVDSVKHASWDFYGLSS
jgi:hypothetical protein